MPNSASNEREYIRQRWRADRKIVRWAALTAALLNPAGWATDVLIAGWGWISWILLGLRLTAGVLAMAIFWGSRSDTTPHDLDRVERLCAMSFSMTVISGVLGPTLLRPTTVASQGGPLLVIIVLYSIAFPVWRRNKMFFFFLASALYVISGMLVRPFTGYGGKHELVSVTIFLTAASVLGPGILTRIERLQREVFEAREDLESTIANLRAESAERARQAEHLEQARREANAANEAKSYFLASVSHDLRTPIAGILGTADLLADSSLNTEQQDLVRVLRSSGRLLLAVVNDIMDLSKLEAGKLVLESVPTDIAQIMDTMRVLLEAQAQDKGIELRMNLDLGPHHVVKTDPVRFQQILLNLGGNAVKFTKTGRVEVRVFFDAPVDDRLRMCIEVQDTGIGMAPETIARLFQPFVQADVTTSRKFGGTGLGLVISKRLIELLGGTITVESQLGQGTTFRVVLPVEPGKMAPLEVKATMATASWHVLVAEDNEINALIAGRVLKALGHTHTRVGDGQAAVEAVTKEKFDVILMDMQMPVMNGLEAVQVIRNLEGAVGKTPIIALTADAIHENRPKYLRTGIDGFLAKPYTKAELSNALEEVIKLRSNAAAASG